MTDLDHIVERRATGSFKWDGTGRMFGHDDLLPFWVADMDFATPAPILDAIRRRLEHPVLGYEERPAEYTETVLAWLADRHDWQVPAEWLKFCPPSSIVAIYGLIVTLTAPGDGIVVPTPTYGPLIDLVKNTNRRLLRCPLREGASRFELDVETMAGLVDEGTRMVLLCSPHNPSGRVFTDDELRLLSELADKHDLLVVSDEVHADLVRPGYRHRPFGTFGHARSATVISPNKSFNTAGLPQATVISPDPGIRAALQGFLDTTQLNHDTTFGAVAMLAAYRECGSWLDAVVEYIDRNHTRVAEFIDAEIPALRVWPAEATYLAWLDYRALELGERDVLARLAEEGGVALYGGTLFGEEGNGFLRMNIACPRATLEQGLAGLKRALG